MKNIVLALVALLGFGLMTQTTLAGDHKMYVKVLTPSAAKEMLVAHGYFTADASRKEMRMGIMKFQSENGLRETGSLNIQTRKALKKSHMLPNIVETAVATPALSTLVAAVTAGGLVETLATGGPFTVFAPTNDAFAKVPAATLASLLTPEGKPALVNILTYHVVSGKAMSTDLYDGQEIKTLQGKTLKVMIKDGKVYINNAQVVIADVKTKNGVVHVIDSVLMP